MAQRRDTARSTARWRLTEEPPTAARVPRPRTAVTLFSGGRGGASIARQLLRTPGIDLSLVINGYDNGLSTGALRRYLPGMLGPSDFRKNLLLHLDRGDPAAGRADRGPRAPPAGRGHAEATLTISSARWPRRSRPGGDGSVRRRCPPCARAAIVRGPGRPAPSARAGTRTGSTSPTARSATSCSPARTSAWAVTSTPRFAPAPGRSGRRPGCVNVTNGENAFLVALKQDGRLLRRRGRHRRAAGRRRHHRPVPAP